MTVESFVSHAAPDPDTPYWLPKLAKPVLVVVVAGDGNRIQVRRTEGLEHFFRDLNADDAVVAAIAVIDSSPPVSAQ